MFKFFSTNVQIAYIFVGEKFEIGVSADSPLLLRIIATYISPQKNDCESSLVSLGSQELNPNFNLHMAFPMSTSLCFSSLLKNISVIFRAHSNLVWSHFYFNSYS